jgi:iron complex transport system substrate-binding protein
MLQYNTPMFRDCFSRGCRLFLAGLTLCGLLSGGFSAPARAEIVVQDDIGREVRLATPARRIVSLAPHLTELAHAAGAGDALVGVSAHSDYPDQVRSLPRVGSGQGLDLERILALRPDLVLAWHSGNPSRALQRLEELGLVLYRSEPADLAAVAVTLERIGALAGTGTEAGRVAREYREGLAALRDRYADRRPVRLFYQLWNPPLMTIGGRHWLNDVLHLCGAVNVFGERPEQVLTLDVEAVLARDPELLLVTGVGEAPGTALDLWRAWPALDAVAQGRLQWLPADRLHRPTPRILEAVEVLCRQIDTARASL